MAREKAAWRKKRDRAVAIRRQAKQAKKCGPVVVRFECPRCAGPHPLIECPQPE